MRFNRLSGFGAYGLWASAVDCNSYCWPSLSLSLVTNCDESVLQTTIRSCSNRQLQPGCLTYHAAKHPTHCGTRDSLGERHFIPEALLIALRLSAAAY